MDRDKRQVKRQTPNLTQRDKKNIEKSVEKAVEKALVAGKGKAKTQVVSFFDFIRERGVMGLAIGIVIGSSVTSLVRSLVDDIINPLVGLVLVDNSLRGSTVSVGKVTIGWGNFTAALIDFVIVALAIYIIFRIFKLEKLDKKKENTT